MLQAKRMSHWLYLFLLLVWVLVLGFQWLIGWKKLWQERHTWPWIVVGASIYFSLADAVAIWQHIWFFHPIFLLGWSAGNLPVEEILFFVLMIAMIVQGFVLIFHTQNQHTLNDEKRTDRENKKERNRGNVHKSRGETQHTSR